MSESIPPTGRDDPPGGRFVEAHNPQGLNPEHPENAHLRKQAEREYKLITPGVRKVLEVLFDRNNVTDTETRLRYRDLINSTVDYVSSFTPMLGLMGGSSDKPGEGRADYLPVPAPEGSEKKEVIMYRKGSGNRELLEGERRYPGFPDGEELTVDKIFYDSPQQGMAASRIRGAASSYDAMSEFMNAAIVFAEMAKREKWENVAQAIDAGVTIPVGVLHLPELSMNQSKIVSRAIGNFDKDSEEYRFYSDSKLINEQLAIVGLIVPGNKRRARENPERAEQLSNKEIMATTARLCEDLLIAASCMIE